MGIFTLIFFLSALCCNDVSGLPTTPSVFDETSTPSTLTTPVPIFQNNGERDQFIMKMSADVLGVKAELKDFVANYDHSSSSATTGSAIHPNIYVAFAAKLTTNISHLGKGQVIRFDDVLINRGSGYDVRLGVFRCPMSGTYQFSLSVASYAGLQLEIVNNGKQIGRVFTSLSHIIGRAISQDQDFMSFDHLTSPMVSDVGGTTGVPASGNGYVAPGSKAIPESTQIIVDLVEGDEVWVRHASDDHNDVIFSDGLTTFSGHLLSAAK